MAPGCFTLEQPQQQQQKVNDFNDDSLNLNNNNNMNSNTTSYDMLILNEISYDLDNIFSNTTSTTKYATSEILKNSNLKPKSFPHIFTSYHHEINLDTIPLPTSPYPYEVEDNNDEQQQQNSSVPSSNAKLCDTVDSFEILEQTIMKQKRLGRSKHVDLRKKVLLKRTFDLVCEIMDHENGFEEEDGEEEVDEQSKNLLNVNTPQESLDLVVVVDTNSNTNETLPNLVNLVYLDTNTESTISTCTSQQQVATDGEQNDKLLRTILNEQTQFNANSNSSLAQLTTMSSSSSSSPSLSQKRKHSLSSLSLSSPSSNKKIKLQSQPQQQRRPSNSDDDDEEEEDEDEDEDEYSENEENFICLFDDDNDPFGIADVVNLTSFKTTTATN
jgi:hypothetical protein